MSEYTQQVLTDEIADLQRRPHRATVEYLADYLDGRVKEHRERESVSSYGAGMDAGMALAFELAAKWIRKDLL